jgi:hypothetical protein
VFAKLPHEAGQSEIVIAPGLECESVEFFLVHVGTTPKSDPHELQLNLQYWSYNLFRGLERVLRGSYSC